MKYWELLNITGGIQTSVPPTADKSHPSLEAILEEMKNIAKSSQQQIPKELESTELNDDQAADVLSTLLRYQKEYFPLIPLREDMIKSFIYNIPKEVYDSHTKRELYMMPDCLDPLFWFYICCVDEPLYSIGTFLRIALELIRTNESWESEINRLDKDYIDDLNDNESEENENE